MQIEKRSEIRILRLFVCLFVVVSFAALCAENSLRKQMPSEQRNWN